jgi:hypothetical protein
MIIKERNPQEHPETDAFSRAGAEAEKQMAHYLRRAFADDPDIAVFNDLRIVDDAGEVAQFDHLVLHRRGFIVIESKSVTSAVQINEAGEWSREWNKKWQGMPSPILQAQRQIDLVKKLLSVNREQLRDKLILGKLQKGFGATPFEIFIAISDKGRIDRDPHTPPEVHKADAIAPKVREAIGKHRMGFLSPGMDNGLEKFSDREFAAICNFLGRQHKPQRTSGGSTPTEPSRVPVGAGVSPTTSGREAPAPHAAHATSAPTAAPRPSAAAAPTLVYCRIIKATYRV